MVSAEIQKDKYSDMAHFYINFASLFLTTMANSQKNDYVKDKPASNTGDGVRAIHYWTKELLTSRQDYEISNGGFGRGQVKPLSDGIAEKGASEQRVNSCAAEKNDEGTSGETSCVDKWVDELDALRSRIEKALSDRLTVEPDNEYQRRLKRKYIEVLDVLPCLSAERLDTFEEGEMLKRTTGGTSSPLSPSQVFVWFFTPRKVHVYFLPNWFNNCLGDGGGGGGNSVGEREQPAQDDMDAASDSGDQDEEVDLNLLISGIAETAEAGGGVSLGDVSVVLNTLPCDKRKKKTCNSVRFFYVCNCGSAGDAGYKEADNLQDVICGLEQLSVEAEGAMSLGDNSQVNASEPVEIIVGSSDVNSPADVGKPGNEKAT
ncbi:hypothetical protein Hanom_Chr00s000496g01646651 [Helianthus anomalus]